MSLMVQQQQNSPGKDEGQRELTPTGTVLAVQANYYQVQLDPLPGAETTDLPRSLLCTRRSLLKKLGQQVMVGDRVVVEQPDWEGGRGAISQVFPRESELDRPPVANANQILLVFALEEPTLDPHQLSRFLIKAESTGLEVCLCLNKSDLVSEAERGNYQERLQQWGYDPLFISVQNRLNIEAVHRKLTGKMTVISGPSGVGKSSLINLLIPNVDLRVAKVSGKLGRGRHTTRHVELFELPNGGLLADTPGFNQPDIDFTPQELGQLFPEVRQRLAADQCQFSDCLHQDEPNCMVRGDWERYDYYREFLLEAIAYQESLQNQSNTESSLKVKTKGSGYQEYEPKLESKKYRRMSRRLQHQTLQDLYADLDGEEEI
ncbi:MULTISPECIES: small ribosomal subunit biogenesis GTPase RsgA [Planktothricoides]